MAVLIVVIVIAFFRSTSSDPYLTDTEQRFLGVLRTAVIWSAAISLICAILFGCGGLYALIRSSMETENGGVVVFGMMGAAGLFTLAWWSFASFLGTMLVFLFVAIEMHQRRRE